MKSFFTPWPKEMNALPPKRKREAIQTIVNKSQKLRITFLLSVTLDMIFALVVIYLGIYVYKINLDSLQLIYLPLGCLTICSLWVIPVKIVAKSEYIRLKSEMY